LANHNVNQRKEIWAPTDLSMFLIDVVGDRCNAIFYQYENSVKDLNYKLKFIGTKNRYYPTIAYGETGSMTAIPIYSIELNYKKVTVESTYSNYRNGDVITYMNGVQFDLPNNYRLEIQQTNHRRRANVGFSSAGTVDDHLLLAMFGEPAQAYIISQHYADVEVILEKESTLNGHRIVYFGQYVAANMGGDLAFATKTHGLIVAQPGSHLMDWVTAWQYRLGASYWLTDELSFAGEWEHNHIISVLPNWQDRIAVGLRVKI
jgi:hypothetical protein